MEYYLVTGGTGFIGSHTIIELLNTNYNVIIIDNLCNSKKTVLKDIQKITNKDLIFYEIDLLNYDGLNEIFKTYKIVGVLHFAGLKSVSESIKNPLEYYINNINGTLNLLKIMEINSCKKIIFSSSATVYGDQESPVSEKDPTGINLTNPYGKTKYMIEEILKDLYMSDRYWSIVILRYFNPIGAHKSGLLKENPNTIPTNIFPYILKVAKREYDKVNIFGNNYETKDGTGVRDFIHVVDLACGHVKAIKKLDNSGIFIYNLGTGIGTSVLELIKTFEKVNNIKIPYSFVEKRPGDLPKVYANVELAEKEMGFKTIFTIEDMCRDGYKSIC